MGLDQYIMKYIEDGCKHKINIHDYIVNGELDSDKLEADKVVEYRGDIFEDVCYWRKHPWVQEFIGRKLGKDIENCHAYLIDQKVITELINAYHEISLALAPYYDDMVIECVNVPKDVQDIVRKAVGPGVFRKDATLREDTLGYMMNGIRKTQYLLERVLYEMENENAIFFYTGDW